MALPTKTRNYIGLGVTILVGSLLGALFAAQLPEVHPAITIVLMIAILAGLYSFMMFAEPESK